MTRQIALLTELNGTTCRCGNEKRHRETFCSRCYFSLSRTQQAALYRKMGRGYEAAYDDAVSFLFPNTEART